MSDATDDALPRGWAWVQLSQLASSEKHAITDGPFGSNLKTEHYTTSGSRVIRLQNIGDGRFNDAHAHISDEHFRSLEKHQICAGDLAIATLGDSLPRACVIPDFVGPAIVKADCIRFSPDQRAVLATYLNYSLNSPTTRQRVSSTIHGVGRPRLRLAEIKTIKIPVAPRNEQSRIADALDELFSDLDAGVVALERVRAKLAFYRASVLKAAVDGTLTAEWRAQHPNVEPASILLERILVERRRRWEEDQLEEFKAKGHEPPKNWKARYKEPVAPHTSTLPELPKGWCWASLDQLGRLDRGRSRHRPRDAAFLYGGPYPFIQTGDVRKARQYLREHSQSYGDAGLEQSRLWPADTLCITIAANIAETAILSYPACFPDSIVGVQFASAIVSVRYVELFIRSARTRISAYAPATAQKNINNEILRALAVPLPPFDEQQAVVDIVEDQLSIVEHLSDDLDSKLDGSKALRQAILRHAFTGQLVPQDPNDEPASELLKRIAAERVARAHEAVTALHGSKRAASTRRRRRSGEQPPPSKYP
jgi:type I restriction enzyme S subunit